MMFLDYAKQFHNFDVFLVLLDDADYTDEEITTKFEVSKQRIYDARKRLDPLIKSLETVESQRKDMRNPDVQAIIEAFSACFGTTLVTKYDRWAAKRLSAKYGAQNIVTVIQTLATFHKEKYVPVVNSVAELETKIVSVGSFINKRSSEVTIDL